MTTRKGLMIVTLGALLWTAGPAGASPIVYDLAADWSDTTNPNGVWSYLYFPRFSQESA